MGRKSRIQAPPPRKGVKPKSCTFCADKSLVIDYKDAATLKRFVSDRGKIRSRRITGCCSNHQEQISNAVKNAREMALLPYALR